MVHIGLTSIHVLFFTFLGPDFRLFQIFGGGFKPWECLETIRRDGVMNFATGGAQNDLTATRCWPNPTDFFVKKFLLFVPSPYEFW